MSPLSNHPVRPDESIPPDDLRIECWPIPGKHSRGGQHCGPGPAGVKITHTPSGVEAFCEVARSQHINRLIAMDMILAAITHPRFRL